MQDLSPFRSKNTQMYLQLSHKHIFLFCKKNLFTKKFAFEDRRSESTRQEEETVHFLVSKMLPLRIAGQVLLQELNALIVMYYTRSTPKHRQTQQFWGKF